VSNSPSTQLRTTAANVFLGYIVACSVAAIALIPFFAISAIGSGEFSTFGPNEVLGMVGGLGMIFLLICVAASPGFAVMRLVLRLLRRSDLPSFAAAGALNALLAIILFTGPEEISIALFIEYPPDPIVPVIGGLAGAAACLAERYFARRAVMKAGGM
jgi:hypothetical protein